MGPSQRRFAIALAVLLVAAGLVFAWFALQPGAAAPVERVAKPAAAIPGHASADLRESPALEAQREAQRGAERAPAAASAPPAAAHTPGFFVRGRCVDERGESIVDVDVDLARYTVELGPDDTNVVSQPYGPVLSARSDAQGRFELEIAFPSRGHVSDVLVEGRTPVRARFVRSERVLRGASSLELGDIVMARGVVLTGLVREVDGAPSAGDEIWVHEIAADGTYKSGTTAATITRKDGTFRVEDAPSGKLRVQVRLSDLREQWSAPIETLPGNRVDGIELVLPRYLDELAISGAVFDVEGKPLPDAPVSFEITSASSSTAGTQNSDWMGFFRIACPDRDSSVSLRASHPRDEAAPVVRNGVRPGEHGIALRLARLRGFLLRVRDEAGEPVTRYRARTKTESPHRTLYSKTKTQNGHPSGDTLLHVDSVPFWIEIRAEGFETALVGPLEPAAVGNLVEATLGRIAGLRGRVTVHGVPLAGARVSALPALGPLETGHVDEFDARIRTSEVGARATTDAEGHFALPVMQSGRWHVRIEADGHPAALSDAVALERGSLPPELSFDLGPRGAIEGTVRNARGAIVPDARIGTTCGDGIVLHAPVDAAGRFRLETLAPGRWQVRVLPTGWNPNHSFRRSSHHASRLPEIAWPCVVREGATTRFDLVVPDASPR